MFNSKLKIRIKSNTSVKKMKKKIKYSSLKEVDLSLQPCEKCTKMQKQSQVLKADLSIL